MKFTPIAIILLLIAPSIFAQRKETSLRASETTPSTSRIATYTAGEICGNGIDDDGNGLVDDQDFQCYFSNNNVLNCKPSTIIWFVNSGNIMYYYDTVTRQETEYLTIKAASPVYDITWAPDGKLYGVAVGEGIIEINPFTGETKSIFSTTAFYFNGLTADAYGNLYATALSLVDNTVFEVVKFNISTGVLTTVFSLSSIGRKPAGDLIFVNQELYVSCLYDIVKLSFGTNMITHTALTGSNPGYDGGYGLVSLNDGVIYTTLWNTLYKVNPVSGGNALYQVMQQRREIYGLASYTEACQSVFCRPVVKIASSQTTATCKNTSPMLTAQGSGIVAGPVQYVWTRPDGTKWPYDNVQANVSGTYYVRYSGISDTCGAVDSIKVTLIDVPVVQLGNDTSLCENGSILLAPVKDSGVSFRWNNGATDAALTVSAPGKYWVQATNSCGTVTDTITIQQRLLPQVQLPVDSAYCLSADPIIGNAKPAMPGESLVWSTGESTPQIKIKSEGMYWLRVTNECGSVTDTARVTIKDECSCGPAAAEVELGPDKELCTTDSLVIRNLKHQQGFRYLWNNGSTAPSITVKNGGTYWCEVYSGCDVKRDTIQVREIPGPCVCNIFAPNVFTPNGDGLNDVFTVKSNCTISGTLHIYNRFGELVFRSSNIAVGWNGKWKGLDQPAGTYIFTFHYSNPFSTKSSTTKGTVTLVR